MLIQMLCRLHSKDRRTKSLEYIRRVFEEQGPFDGIAGISEGGGFANYVMRHHVNNPAWLGSTGQRLRFQILIAPIVGGEKDLYKTPVSVPTLIVLGDNEMSLVSAGIGIEAQDHLLHCTMVHHAGGHEIPMVNPSIKAQVAAFLELFDGGGEALGAASVPMPAADVSPKHSPPDESSQIAASRQDEVGSGDEGLPKSPKGVRTMAQKADHIKKALDLDPSFSLPKTIQAANDALGLNSDGNLVEQANSLLQLLG